MNLRLLILLFILSGLKLSAATFSIESIHVHTQPGYLSAGITRFDKSTPPHRVFIPQVEVQIKVTQDAPSANLLAKAYFYDASGKLIQTCVTPAKATRPSIGQNNVTGTTFDASWPTILPANKIESLYFPLPQNFSPDNGLLVVFGNAHGVVAASLPENRKQVFNFPEEELVAKTLLSPDVKIDVGDQMAPLIEQVVKSANPAYPAFTLLLHLPHGVTDPHDVNGVLATCMIANSVSEIRDRLNAIKAENDRDAYFAFAEAHKLAVVAWGARWVWSSYANFDELDQGQARIWDENFAQLANAWDHGIQLLVDQYGLPDHDYLMYGFCAGGEWAHRLALHKPDRFLAVQMHISTSYDAPTPEASRVMWLLTTGELDHGCDRARRFFSVAEDLHYPIVYKAIVGLGHSDCAAADRLGIRFFEYALDMKERRDAAVAADPQHAPRPLDLSSFEKSPFYGDLMNQTMFAAQDKRMIPAGFLVPLPTRDIAEAWSK